VGASGSSLLAGASGLLVEELLAAGGLLAGASNRVGHAGTSGSSLLAGASGLLVEELLAAGGLLVGTSNRVRHVDGHMIGVGGGGQMSWR
jgi:hypothetical protein